MDEISLSSALSLFHISETLKSVVGKFITDGSTGVENHDIMQKIVTRRLDSSKPFGGVDVILGGDFFQIPSWDGIV